MAALLVEICKEVQFSDVERAFLIYFGLIWLFVTPFCFWLRLFRLSHGRKKGDENGSEV